MEYAFRQTKIVVTLGPATESEEILERLVRSGVDVCRLNMAHASHEWTREIIERLRAVCRRVGRSVSVLMDVKGPEVRTGDVPEIYHLEKGETFDFFVDEEAYRSRGETEPRGVMVNYPGLVNDIKAGETVLVDSGLIRMRVLEVTAQRVRCEVVIPGPMGNRRHINLPGVKINLPCLTGKDRRDIALGIEEEVEFYALSFVREADDLDIMRRHLTDRGSQARIVAKIEDQSAIRNLDEIIQASDGLMVARGDLGIEVPYEDLPGIQRRAVQACITAGKPVIIATHMLESMISSPIPTRAEITDVSNAVRERADCVMLSGETSVGKYPVECVEVLNRIITKVEREAIANPPPQFFRPRTPRGKMLWAAAVLAKDLDCAAVAIFTRSGSLARKISSMRPVQSPVYAFTDVPLVFHHLLLLWGIEPFLIEFSEEAETTIQRAFQALKEGNWSKSGDSLVVVASVFAGKRAIDSIQYRTLD